MSESDEFGIRHADQETQSAAKRHRFRRLRNAEETSQIWKRNTRQSCASRHTGEGESESDGIQQIGQSGEDADESDTIVYGTCMTSL